MSDAAGNEASVTRVATVKEKSGETPASLATRIRTAARSPARSPARSRARIPTRTVIRTTKATRSRAATGASVSVVAIAAIGLLATGAVSVAVRRRRDI